MGPENRAADRSSTWLAAHGGDWDAQMMYSRPGYRVIAHDRRGHGGSRRKRSSGNEMDTYADDVAALRRPSI